MKQSILIIGILFFYLSSSAQEGIFQDSRDGKTYKTIKIGEAEWFAQNLAYQPNDGHYFAYKHDEKFLNTFGYLYSPKTAIEACPIGWHVATQKDWDKMMTEVAKKYNNGDEIEIATMVKAKSVWAKNQIGTNESKLNLVPAGIYKDGAIKDWGSLASYWALNNSDSHKKVVIDGSSKAIILLDAPRQIRQAMAVRCVKD